MIQVAGTQAVGIIAGALCTLKLLIYSYSLCVYDSSYDNHPLSQKLDPRLRGIDLVKTLGLMNVSQRRDYFMIIMMFKSIHGLVPDYICDEITMQRDITVRTSRSTVNNNVHVPHIILECCKNAFAYRGPVLWNALPENIKKCETLNCFIKQCVKLHVVE